MFGGKFNLIDLMKNAKKLQEMMEKTQEELAKVQVTGESGAGAVKIIMSANHAVQAVQIDDELLKEPKAIIEDLVRAAMNDAAQKVEKIAKSKMSGFGDLFGSLGGGEKE